MWKLPAAYGDEAIDPERKIFGGELMLWTFWPTAESSTLPSRRRVASPVETLAAVQFSYEIKRGMFKPEKTCQGNVHKKDLPPKHDG
jgi:hypothetical protein